MAKTGTKKGALLRPLAYQWFRGPASRDRDAIVLDGRRAERYQPMAHPHIGVHLAKVKTPDDAVLFVERYGLLNQPRGVLEWEPCPADVREPFANFEKAGDDLRRIFRTVIDVRKAVDGDRQALERLRSTFGPADPDRTMLIHASDWAALGLSNGVVNGRTHPYVFEPAAEPSFDAAARPGAIRIGVISDTLLGYCYLSAANVLAAEPIATCEECQCAFVVEDGRQKFCDAACANRTRFRRYKNRKAETAATRKNAKKTTTTRRSKHGKTTRTK